MSKNLTPNQQAVEVIAQLIQRTNGAGLFKELRDLDYVRGAFAVINSELNRLAELDKKPGIRNGSAGKSK